MRARQLGGGRPGHHRTRVFEDWRVITAWICDHLLSVPEAPLWARHLPVLAPLIADRSARESLARSAWETEGEALKELYTAWVALLGRNASEGYRRGWWWIEEETSFYFTPLGALLVIEGDRFCGAPMLGVDHPRLAATAAERDPVERKRRPLPLDRTPRLEDPGVDGAGESESSGTFLNAAREARSLFFAATERSESPINSPRFSHRLAIADLDACRLLLPDEIS